MPKLIAFMALAFALAAQPAAAATITFLEEAGGVSVTSTDLPAPIYSSTGVSYTRTFTAVPTPPFPPTPNPFYFLLLDPFDTNRVLDMVTVRNGPLVTLPGDLYAMTTDVFWQSAGAGDANGLPRPVSGIAGAVVETGGLQRVGAFGDVTIFASGAVLVPEPATSALFALGLAMLAVAMRRASRRR